jgi:hypothetical protein
MMSWPLVVVGEFQAQHLRVAPGLLHGGSGMLVDCLRFDHGKGKVASVPQQVIDALRRLSDKALADGDHPAVGDRALFGDRMRVVIPSSGLNLGNDVFSAGVSFSKHLRGVSKHLRGVGRGRDCQIR